MKVLLENWEYLHSLVCISFKFIVMYILILYKMELYIYKILDINVTFCSSNPRSLNMKYYIIAIFQLFNLTHVVSWNVWTRVTIEWIHKRFYRHMLLQFFYMFKFPLPYLKSCLGKCFKHQQSYMECLYCPYIL